MGHSLGLIKLLNLPLKYRALVGLQSFINFLGFNPDLRVKRGHALKRMCRNIQAYPHATLEYFYQTCDNSIKDKKKSIIQLTSPDFRTLGQDLNQLFQPCLLPSAIPLFILGASQDKIVPPELIYDNFASAKNVHMDFYQGEGHCLGYDHANIVVKKILDFIDVYS